MARVLAERFVENGRAWIDLANGMPVRLRIIAAGNRASQVAWSDRCAELARLRHPIMNVLLDYGSLENDTIFEAYSIGGGMKQTGTVTSVNLTHASRFLESRGLELTRDVADCVLRDTAIGQQTSRGRPLGIYLQPRAVLGSIVDAMADVTPGGVATIEVCGSDGSGLRTLRLQAVRAARLAGYLPIASGVLLYLPWLRDALCERHLCVVLDEAHAPPERQAVARLLGELGTASPRRHVLLRFVRGSTPSTSSTLTIEPMDLGTIMSMVYVDRDCGPSNDEIAQAARSSGGQPGPFLRSLRGATFDEHVSRASTVHETAATYAVESPAATAASWSQSRESGIDPTSMQSTSTPVPRSDGRRGIGHALARAAERASRLAANGRHASAVRLLSRATRVLEARSERRLAATCAEQLAWIARDRGRSDVALAQFERARHLCDDSSQRLASTIGIGIVWTDERRFLEADAALRAACAAADLLRDDAVVHRAARALARCLFWQGRYDEALAILDRLVQSAISPPADTWALMARTRIATGDLPGAVAAANESVIAADRQGHHRLIATAARAMAVVQRALGDTLQTRHWIERGLRACSAAHLPLMAFRLRCLDASHRVRTVPHLPPLLRCGNVESTDQPAGDLRSDMRATVHERALTELRDFLETAQSATDDGAAIEAICRQLLERTRAATVQIVGGSKELQTFALAGRSWHGDLRMAEEIMAGRAPNVVAALSSESRRAAEAIRFGRDTIAVLCCRWTPGVLTDHHRMAALMSAAALAAAGAVRGLLDRPDPAATQSACQELIGECAATTALREAIVRAARAPFPVLVEGESGSGKELVARAIHRLGLRRERRLSTVNCAALSDDLLEAELFGHTRGAFTGAVGDRQGLFEEADGGTLFLDEVGELSARAQAKLLRALQDGEVRRVGENMPRRVDVRVIAATNRALGDEVSAGRFRADLRFRLDVVRIVVPPLRERPSDIPALATHFWLDATRRVGSSATLTAEAIALLSRYDWPGNVRELQNVVASLAVHAPRRGRIAASVLPGHIASISASRATTYDAARYDFERRFIRAALAQAGGRRARAARAIGVSRQGLSKMMRRLRIEA